MPPKNPLLDRLNPEQRRAVTTTEGPVLVLAGAGTGKTSVITARISHILSRRVPARAILALTFTNKAAGEMRERVGGAVGKTKAKDLTIGTFHSFAVRSLRANAKALGMPKGFSICDASDQLATVKGALRELRISEQKMQPGVLQSKISLLKNRSVTADEFLDGADDDEAELIGRAYRGYEAHLRRSRCLDFDDLLLFMVKLLREDDKVRQEFRDRYRYVMVDEYQDTNSPQYEIVHQIAEEHRNICVVGDDDQSIYSWRGADIQKILGFERDFPGAAVIRLETNYRSTEQILGAANRVIRNNATRHEKTLRSAKGKGDDVRILSLDDEVKEAEHVVRDIVKVVAEREYHHGQIAILIRTQAQTRVFEAELRSKSVPYVLVGGMSFFDRKEIKDVLAFLKLVANPEDEVSLLRIINTPPRGVGKTTVDRVLSFATANGLSAAKAFDRGDEIPGASSAGIEAVQKLRRDLGELSKTDPGKGLVEFLQKLLKVTNYRAEVDRCYPDASTREDRWLTVMEILNFAENYVRRASRPTLRGFLDELTLTANDDKTDEDAERRRAVTIMTLHGAKGLEFPRVYLVGLEEGILPHMRAVHEGSLDEERRLMYVGITRAQDTLMMSYARARAKFGRRVESQASRFIFEVKGEDPPAGWYPAGTTPPQATVKKKARRKKARRKTFVRKWHAGGF